ncbi:hypothetical protein NDU88_001197 [Pleurodeles waltl]|uniref:Myb/SANT-like DNA-binding domain-containing protein n=1 Tax=Pleurodeles waltl TaxID=8319 RepID=A0AAV7S8A6_PLEWA|nr:hypothetical protein NDU88_001197 [Pleurodeles waltl]
MAAASGERAPAFTAQELEKLVDGVLPQYMLLYCPPDQQVSAHQKRDIWCAIAKEVRTLGAHQRQGTHCRKKWEDICRCSKKTAEAQLGMASQRGRGARGTMTPLMFWILAVAYPELDGRLRTSQQTQGGSRTRSQGTGSPPPVKAPKLESGRRDRVKTPGWSSSEMGSKAIDESTVTPKKVGKVQRKSAQPVVSVTAEKCAIISGGPDTTASTVVTGPETTARVTAQEGPSIVTGPETTARVTAQEGPSIVTYRHWSRDHRQSHSPGGPKYHHWSRDHRQSHSPGGPKPESQPRRAQVSSLVQRPPPESQPRRAQVSLLVQRPPPESQPRRGQDATAPLANDGMSCHTPMSSV